MLGKRVGGYKLVSDLVWGFCRGWGFFRLPIHLPLCFNGSPFVGRPHRGYSGHYNSPHYYVRARYVFLCVYMSCIGDLIVYPTYFVGKLLQYHRYILYMVL